MQPPILKIAEHKKYLIPKECNQWKILNLIMDKNNSRGYIMVINSRGGRKQVRVEDYNKSKKLNEDNINMSDYEYDLAWDLSQGFTEANKAFSDIEKNT